MPLRRSFVSLEGAGGAGGRGSVQLGRGAEKASPRLPGCPAHARGSHPRIRIRQGGAAVRRIHVVHVLNGLNTGGTERGVRKLVTGLDAELFEQTICALRPADGGEPASARLVSLDQTGRG